MISNVVLVGRLTRDPELKKTQNGTSVLSFTTAVNRKFQKDGEHNADFVKCVAWNQTADFLSRYATKGALVGVEGRIQTRTYDDKSGNKIFVTEVVCASVQLLESKAEAERRQTHSSFNQSENTQSNYEANVEEEFGEPTLDINSDDLPF